MKKRLLIPALVILILLSILLLNRGTEPAKEEPIVNETVEEKAEQPIPQLQEEDDYFFNTSTIQDHVEEPVIQEPVVEEPEIECFSDSDCDDGYDCSIDTCEYAGTKYAYCNHEEVTRRTSTQTDGCCPSWENADTDMDCEPVCGNGICEFGEMEATCKVDCENAGGSATGVAAPIGRATAK